MTSEDDRTRPTNVVLLKPPRMRTYTFVRSVAEADIPKGSIDQGYGVAFKLVDLPGSGEFTALFDRYRFDWVDYTFTLKTPAAALPFNPILYVFQDHDDTSPPSRSAATERDGVKILSFSPDRNIITVRLRPTILASAYKSAVSSGYEVRKPGAWVDCADADLPHYGLKYFIDNYNTGVTNTIIGVVLRYQLSFQSVL